MKSILMCVGLALVATAHGEDKHAAMFNEFKTKYSKAYPTPEEEAQRYNIFVKNMQKAEAMQAINPHATFGINTFSDVDWDQFHKDTDPKGAQWPDVRDNMVMMSEASKLAAKGQIVDWTAKGAVTAVKNQGFCGSCWSFSTTGNIEGQWQIAGNQLTSLSEQELLSCDFNKYNNGCSGGSAIYALMYIYKNQSGKIVTAASYPLNNATLLNKNTPCQANHSILPVGAMVNGYIGIEANEAGIAAFVLEYGPVAVSLEDSALEAYNGGIISACKKEKDPYANHAALITGYNDVHDPPYWILKNSWGENWGVNGYAYLQKGTNPCMLMDDPISATVEGGRAKMPVNVRNGSATMTGYNEYGCKGKTSFVEHIPLNKCTTSYIMAPPGTMPSEFHYYFTCNYITGSLVWGLTQHSYVDYDCTGKSVYTQTYQEGCSLGASAIACFDYDTKATESTIATDAPKSTESPNDTPSNSHGKVTKSTDATAINGSSGDSWARGSQALAVAVAALLVVVASILV